MDENLQRYAPPFVADEYSAKERYLIEPFFSNLDQSVYLALIPDPELVGALMSRASRATGDLRTIFLRDYIKPMLHPVFDKEKDTEATWQEKLDQASEMWAFIDFLHVHPFSKIFANKRARDFYTKWLAQYGDDSIAQMTGMHLVFANISQITIKHFEDQRIGLAPIEQSTRYVPYDTKVAGRYRYYTDPDLDNDTSLEGSYLFEEFEAANELLFETYSELIPQLKSWLTEKYPEVKANDIEKKAFDSLRGLLPMGTQSQVAFYGNAQAFEHLINRGQEHPLGEIRWAANRVREELSQRTPSLFRRVNDDSENSVHYQKYLAGKTERLRHESLEITDMIMTSGASEDRSEVKIIDHDPIEKIITAMIYSTADYHESWQDTYQQVLAMNEKQRDIIITKYLSGRNERWMKVGRAFEMSYVTIEIMMNIGAWRDLHRHRMLTQIKQSFSCYHSYDTPAVLMESGLGQPYREALNTMSHVFAKIAQRDENIAQYATCLSHRMRFVQHKNIRECFWEGELRTTQACHPDYRKIEQLIFKELEKIYPLITKHSLVDMNDYDFARRGEAKKIEAKLQKLNSI